MSIVEDIRALLDEPDVDFVRAHRLKLQPDSVVDVAQLRYGGGDGVWLFRGTLIAIGAALFVAGGYAIGHAIVSRRKG